MHKKPHSEEARKKISKKMSGRTLSETTKLKMSMIKKAWWIAHKKFLEGPEE